jgi:signal transduction histidine kinase
MVELLNNVLEISAIESGVDARLSEFTNLRSIIEESISLCRPLANRRGTPIKVVCPETSPVVRIHPRRMRQVLVNLIGNAIKYSQNGANVRVTVAPRADHLIVTVADNGPGIPSEEISSIFKPFHRRERPSAERGTGLGLAICKRIIERHRGKIWVESTPGHGTSFHLSLPIRARSAGKPKAASAS